jgi:hypothetical protein
MSSQHRGAGKEVCTFVMMISSLAWHGWAGWLRMTDWARGVKPIGRS